MLYRNQDIIIYTHFCWCMNGWISVFICLTDYEYAQSIIRDPLPIYIYPIIVAYLMIDQDLAKKKCGTKVINSRSQDGLQEKKWLKL